MKKAYYKNDFFFSFFRGEESLKIGAPVQTSQDEQKEKSEKKKSEKTQSKNKVKTRKRKKGRFVKS